MESWENSRFMEELSSCSSGSARLGNGGASTESAEGKALRGPWGGWHLNEPPQEVEKGSGMPNSGGTAAFLPL